MQSVDRINDDLLSILTAEGLYDRKAVVVWPTEDFLKLPDDPKKLADVCNMKLVELVAVVEKDPVPPQGLTVERYRELVAVVRSDEAAMAGIKNSGSERRI